MTSKFIEGRIREISCSAMSAGVLGVLRGALLPLSTPRKPAEIAEKGCGAAQSDSQFDYRGAASAFVLRGLGDGRDVGMLLQHLAESFAQDSHAAAVDHANPR